MRKKMFSLKNIVMLFMALVLLTSVGCRKQDDGDKVTTEEVQNVKADLQKKLDALKNDLKSAKEQLQSKLDGLSAKEGVTKEELQGSVKDLVNQTVLTAALEKYLTKEEAKNYATLKMLAEKTSQVEFSKAVNRIATLEALVGDNKKAVEKSLKDLEEKLSGSSKELVAAEVKKLQDQITANKAGLADFLKKYTADKKDLNDKVKDLTAKFDKYAKDLNLGVLTELFNARLTSLVLLPEYVSAEGGALPLINFSSVSTKCGTLVPEVLVKYVVNPSTVTKADIDTDKISFRYNDPISLTAKKKTEGVEQKAEFVSLENGILTVKATVNTAKLWAETNSDKRINELMLQVPTKDGAVVSSDWVKVVYMPKQIKLTKSVALSAVTKADILPATLKAAKVSAAHDMAWDSTLDLNTLVKKYVTYKGAFESADDYKGLTFEYNLKDEDGNRIVFNKGTNKTDQQEFAKLDGSNFSTRVYSEAPNSAAVGRTPIVHVMLKKGDCTVTEGFIKFNIVKKVIPPVPPITFERVGKTINAECGADVEAYRVNTEEMNVQFYHKVDMSKEDFHTNYTFAEGEGVGTVNQITDPEDDTSYNLVYTLSQDEVWNNIGKTVSKTATYTYGTSVINMIFKAHIVNEKVVLAAPVDNFWDAEKTFVKHNVAVPQSVNDKDPNHATFENNLNDVFNRVEGEKVLELGDATKYAGYNYEYKFVPVAEQPIKTVTGHKDGVITISVSEDGKELKATQGSVTETIAKITNHADSSDRGDLLSYKEDSELGKWLLNHEPEFMEARLVLEVTNSCGKNVDVEVSTLKDGNKFNVHFLRPINSASKSPKHFVDGVDFGAEGSYIDVRELLDLSDWRNRIKDTKDYDFLPSHKNYFKFYGVESIEPDHENITVKEGLKVGGKPVTKLPENFQIEFNTTDFTGLHPDGVLSYKNNGFNLENDFTITVPVVVTYKWGKIETSVDVVVKATSKSAATTNN